MDPHEDRGEEHIEWCPTVLFYRHCSEWILNKPKLGCYPCYSRYNKMLLAHHLQVIVDLKEELGYFEVLLL